MIFGLFYTFVTNKKNEYHENAIAQLPVFIASFSF